MSSLSTFVFVLFLCFVTQPTLPEAHTSVSTLHAMKDVIEIISENPELVHKFLVLFRSMTQSPTDSPTDEPTLKPTSNPTESPTGEPSAEPTPKPTTSPTTEPTSLPTYNPTHPSQCYIGITCVDTEDCCPDGLDATEMGLTCSRISPGDEALVEACCIKHDKFGCVLDEDCCGNKSICHEDECLGRNRQQDLGLI
eukprot:257950_1